MRSATTVPILRSTLAAAALAALLWLSIAPPPPLPPLAPFLDPIHGVWSIARAVDLPEEDRAPVAGLTDSVIVRYDDRGVPHVFAATVEDAARAFGYVVARDRSFQLEMQSRLTEGTLSELVGRRAVPLDRARRRLGLAWSARRLFDSLPANGATRRMARGYADGVNAYLANTRPEELPFEYHLLGARPRPWEPVYTLYLVREMGYTLSFSRLERERERLVEAVGENAAAAILPIHSPIQQPIEPGHGPYPRFDWVPIPPPELADAGANASDTEPVALGSPRRGGDDLIGSNNWAVAPERTANGRTLLAGDPHLRLTLPSTWYEAHLVVPDEQNAYGVALPGAPILSVGFNPYVAWSMTTTGLDAVDYYEETVDDPDRPARYLVDDEWRRLESREEIILGKRGRVAAVDTVLHTHRGPLERWRDGRWVSVRWTVYDEGARVDVLQTAQEARSVSQWLDAMAGYDVPAQNGIVADAGGTIAIRSMGLFPRRPPGVTGDRVLDGSRSANDWQGYLSPEEYPQAVAPEQGFLASANQEPVDGAVRDDYLGWDWPPPWRAMRINRLLRENTQVTPDAMRQYQRDPGSERADLFHPLFIEALEGARAGPTWDAGLDEALGLLREWERRYTPDDRRAVLFERLMAELRLSLWDEIPEDLSRPDDMALWRLLRQPASPWWDDRATADTVETRDDILLIATRRALEIAKERYGEPDGDGWRWDRIQSANVYHLMGFRSLSALRLPVQGGPSTLSPSSGSGVWGPSWRMVVELGPEVRAWVTYPGGQSGNPASPRYDDRISEWVAGELTPALLPRAPEQLPVERVTATLVLVPEER
jgi:penicillin amidase